MSERGAVDGGPQGRPAHVAAAPPTTDEALTSTSPKVSRHGGRDGSAARSPWLMLPYARALVMTGTRLSAQVAAPPDPSRMPPQGWVSSPKQFDAIKVASDFLMPTRDGKRMVTDIYRPARS